MPLHYFRSHGLEGFFLISLSHSILFACLFFPAIKSGIADIPKKLLFGIAFAGGAGIVCFTYALIYGSVVRVMVLFYLLPMWGVLGGRIFLNEKIDRARWFGVTLALLGAFLVLGGIDVLMTPPNWIDLLALASGICFAANNLLFRAFQHMSLTVKACSMFLGCSLLAGTLLIVGAGTWPTDIAVTTWGFFSVYVVIGLLLANIGSLWAVERLEAGQASIIIIVQLLVAVISAVLVGGEKLSLVESIGCIFIVTAALIEGRRNIPKEL